MDFVILPKIGIGPVTLGMSKDEVRKVLGIPACIFRQNQFAKTDTDYFRTLGIQVDYDGRGICNFITALADARPTLYGRQIIGMSFR